MMHLPIRSGWKLPLLVLVVLALGLSAGLMLSAPAMAQGPENATQVSPSDALAPLTVSRGKQEAALPAGHVSSSGSNGDLHVHVSDWLTGRPLGDRVISIYDRDGNQVARKSATCLGYVEFDQLSSGPYRVVLEPDPDWTTVRRSNLPGGRNAPGEWVWVRPYWRMGVYFYEAPNVSGAGLRVYAYHANSRQANQRRQPLAGAAFTLYDANGDFVANGVTGCAGFVDFNNLGGGQYRVVDANQPDGPYMYPPSGERWVSLEYGAMTSTWFFTVPSPGPESTPTPVP
jgi:hypothetical protein